MLVDIILSFDKSFRVCLTNPKKEWFGHYTCKSYTQKDIRD
jgi:hypothetical protein